MTKRIVSLLIASIFFLSSCSLGGSRIEMLNKDNDGGKADTRLEQVLEAIKNQDKNALRGMFSKQALDEAENLDGRMDYLFGFIQGEIESWENDRWSSGESIEYGKKSVMIRSWYTVTTDTNVYKLFFIDYAIDTINPDNAGLYTLRVIKAEDEETQFTYWQDMKIAGIYKPNENTSSTSSDKS